jgi:hypothetical protein
MERDEEFKNLLREITELITGILAEIMRHGTVKAKLNDVNRRLTEKYGCVVGGISVDIEVLTIPVSSEKRVKGSTSSTSLFQFGGSREDQEMGKRLGLSQEEMNQLLEEARLERGQDASLLKAMPARGEKETNEPVDSRSIDEIISSMEEIAKTLNFNQRQFLMGLVRGKALSFCKDNNAWLEWVHHLFDEAKKIMGNENQSRIALLALEKLFKAAQKFRRI